MTIERLRKIRPDRATPDEVAELLTWSADEIERLQAALKQAYLDGGCREDEAAEMVQAVSTKDKDHPPEGSCGSMKI